jgi:DNA polymerase eta
MVLYWVSWLNCQVLAKLACGINKPNKQTVLPHSSVPELWAKTKLKKVRNLGGKLGDYFVEKLECEFMSDLKRFTEKELSTHVGSKTGYASIIKISSLSKIIFYYSLV